MTENPIHTCTGCTKYAPRAARVSILGFQSKHPGWETIREHDATKLQKQFQFNVFDTAIAFAEQLVYLAKAEGHHPVIRLERNTMTVIVTWWTQKIKNIHNQDLILAQQTERLFELQQYSAWPMTTELISHVEKRSR